MVLVASLSLSNNFWVKWIPHKFDFLYKDFLVTYVAFYPLKFLCFYDFFLLHFTEHKISAQWQRNVVKFNFIQALFFTIQKFIQQIKYTCVFLGVLLYNKLKWMTLVCHSCLVSLPSMTKYMNLQYIYTTKPTREENIGISPKFMYNHVECSLNIILNQEIIYLLYIMYSIYTSLYGGTRFVLDS